MCGVVGLALGGPMALWLARRHGLSPWIELALIAVAVAMLLAVPLAVKVFTGIDGFVFYRDVICILAAVALTLRWLHQPVLPYLDVTIAGAGLFHAWGRIGCLLSGCCYGRPSRLGIRYTHAHAEMGFPTQLTGVRLFPIQAVESLWILCLASGAVWMILRNSRPGSVFAAYVAGYALGRFFFEFARGDADRPYFVGFSQAQWISLVLTFGVGLLGGAEFPRHSIWLSAPFLLLAVSMAVVALARRFETMPRFELLDPRLIVEIADLVRRPPSQPSARGPQRRSLSQCAVEVKRTSVGVRVSVGEIPCGGVNLRHYCLSKDGELLSPKATQLLARQISLIQHDGAPFHTVHLPSGVIHLLF
jgi:prolipoprotein diacylglyceryltransferase